MRPRQLRLKNFGCFRGEHAIDFTELNSDLFAIAGPIGSGKSTLLDAITWTLYGQTPRLGKQGVRDQIFSPGESDLGVALEFEAGGDEYRATRTLKRRPSGISGTVKLERRSGDRWLGVAETEKIQEYETALQKAVGLDYEGYIRAVMLPQGAFDEFLRGNADKRQEVIKRLLKAYTISRMRELAARERGEAEIELEKARARLDNEYQGVTPEREAELDADLKGREEELTKAQKEIEGELAKLKELDTLKALDEELRQALADLERVEGERESVTEAQASIERANAANGLAPVIKNYRARQEELSKASTNLTAQKSAATEAERQREETAKQHQQAVAERSTKQEGLKRQQAQVEASRRDAALLKRRGGSVENATQADEGEFDEDRLNTLVELTAKVGELRQLERAANTAATNLSKSKDELSRKRELLKAQQERFEEVLAEGKRLREAADAAKAAHDAAWLEDEASAFRQHLHEGEECPVCHSVVTSVPTSDKSVDLEALKNDADEAEKAVGDLRTEYGQLRANVDNTTASIDQLERNISQELEGQAASSQKEYEAALEGFVGFGQNAQEVTAALGEEQALQLARLAKRVTRVTGGRDFEELTTAISKAITQLDEAVDAAQQALNAADTRVAGATARRETAVEQENEAQKRLEAAKSDLDEALANSAFDTLEAVEAATLDVTEIEALKRRIDEHQQRHSEATGNRMRVEKELAGRTYDAVEHQRASGEVQQRQADINQRAQAIGSVKQELQTLRSRLEELKELRAEAEKVEEHFQVLHNLELSLRSNKFEAYVLGHAQAELAANASVIIHELTDGRYELTYNGEFYVRDTWMDAHERSAKTLSGGESFIVSLALALALAETIAGQQVLGALFLDEGFGTLDPETLDGVTEVLMNLTTRGRMVGVITHVASLSERLPARLMVDKQPQGSSVTWDA